MSFTFTLFAAGLAVAISAEPVQAFGRGAAVQTTRVGPAGGVTTTSAARGVSTGPLGGVHSAQVQSSTRVGPGGTTVQHVGGSSVSRGPLGGVQATAGSATRVTGPGGNAYTRTSGAGVTAGPLGGVRVGAGSISSVGTPYGTGAMVSQRSSVAVGPFGGVRSASVSTTAVRTPFGGAAIGTQGSVVAVGSPVAVGVEHSTPYLSPNSVRATAYAARSTSSHVTVSRNWYQDQRTTWVAPRWVAGYSLWRPTEWGTTAAFVGITSSPVVYEYGSTAVIQDKQVYINGEPVASAEDYSAQANQIVDAGRKAKPAENDEWQPLGMFGLLREDEKSVQRQFQLAINKDGIVRGNYYDPVADNTLPVVGSVDKKTQRVAWSIGDRKDIVFEAGLSNFSQEGTTVLVHFGKDSTQQMILVRLEEPKDAK